jgi:hypothetical protein
MLCAYRLKGTGGRVGPGLLQPAWHGVGTWLTEGRLERSAVWVWWYGFQQQDGKLRTVSLYRRPLTHTVSKALATSRKTAPVSRLSSKFLLTLSQRGPAAASCCAWVGTQTARRAAVRVCLLPGGPYWVGSCRISCQQCQVDLRICRKGAAWGPSQLQCAYHARKYRLRRAVLWNALVRKVMVR